MKYVSLFLVVVFLKVGAIAQVDLHAVAGNWEGKWQDPGALGLHLGVRALAEDRYRMVVYGRDTLMTRDFRSDGRGTFVVRLDTGILFKGRWDGTWIEGFVCAGRLDYHVLLRGPMASGRPRVLTGEWNPILVAMPDSTAYLDVEVDSAGGGYEAYPFLRDNRWSGFWAFSFQRTGNTLSFRDGKTGLGFVAHIVDTNHILLEATFGGHRLTGAALRPSVASWNLQRPVARVSYYGRTPGGHEAAPGKAPLGGESADGSAAWRVASPTAGGLDTARLAQMEDSIYAGSLTNVHSVLVARSGKLIYEGYFGGFDASVPHDLRSAAKSFGSAVTGLAIAKGKLASDETRLFPLLPPPYRDADRGDTLKSNIRIKDLLTMSSGLDAVDFGINRTSPGSEDEYQRTPDWLETVVRVPMLSAPGLHALYSSANPYLLGVAVDSVTGPEPEHFMDRLLFEPLGITDYVLQQDDKGRPYFGGGWHLRPLDMLTFGQTYLDGGVWNGARVLPEEWVKTSTLRRLTLENHPEKPGYGYLWWTYSYTVGVHIYKTIEARGAGGQYIFIVPSEGLVVVMTSGNFRNGRTNQPEKILQEYILPALR
jgi:CubicO group peptidase (beta-lactamase class C family)